jgi:hypothetical protein
MTQQPSLMASVGLELLSFVSDFPYGLIGSNAISYGRYKNVLDFFI